MKRDDGFGNTPNVIYTIPVQANHMSWALEKVSGNSVPSETSDISQRLWDTLVFLELIKRQLNTEYVRRFITDPPRCFDNYHRIPCMKLHKRLSILLISITCPRQC